MTSLTEIVLSTEALLAFIDLSRFAPIIAGIFFFSLVVLFVYWKRVKKIHQEHQDQKD